MTKKDFELIAQMLNQSEPAIHGVLDVYAHTQWSSTVEKFSETLKATYPRFDADRFKRACNLRG